MKVLLCTGNRPDIIKLAPVYHALRETTLEPFVVHAGQDQDAIGALYEFFGIEPDHRLSLHCRRPSLAHLGALLMEQIDQLLERVPVAAALVHGNTSPAVAVAQVAAYRRLPVGHMPAEQASDSHFLAFPEAHLRAQLSALATWHFAAMPETVKQLQATGCPEQSIFYVRNTIVDATQWGLQNLLAHSARTPGAATVFSGDFLKQIQAGRVVLVNTQDPAHDTSALAQIAQAMCVLLEAHADLRIVWPTHGRDGVRDVVRQATAVLAPDLRKRLILVESLSYPQTLWLLKQTWLVVTDTPDLQEEAATLHVPVIVLHQADERPDRAEQGGRALLKIDPNAIYLLISRLCHHPDLHARMATADNPFGDGRAGRHIARIIQRELAHTPAPPAVLPLAPKTAATAAA